MYDRDAMWIYHTQLCLEIVTDLLNDKGER
jgi:hypothetical protein